MKKALFVLVLLVTLAVAAHSVEPPVGSATTAAAVAAGVGEIKSGITSGVGSPTVPNINGGGNPGIGSQKPPPPQKLPPPPPMPGAELVVKPTPVTTYYYYKDPQGEWRWRLQTANGRIIAESADGYAKKSDCLDDITLVKKAANAPVKMQ